jgi:hypothetical protein
MTHLSNDDRFAGNLRVLRESFHRKSEIGIFGRILRCSFGTRYPTLVIITDRNDLDEQLFGQFSRAGELLRETPVQAESREELRQMLAARPSGGVIFTTIQKFTTYEYDRTLRSCQSSVGKRRDVDQPRMRTCRARRRN